MNEHELTERITTAFAGVTVPMANGDSFFLYDPDGDLPPERQLPFATIVTADTYESDSHLDRPGVYRFNIGLTKATYTSMFPASGEWDYAALDLVMPHPTYAPQYWICVVSPSVETIDELWPLVTEAYEFAARKHANHQARQHS
jgi:hypothetical protein